MFKVGQGIDIHKIVKGNTQQKIGGVLIDSEYKIVAHSDGDIVLHSISSAISGALSMNDLGTYFPDNKKDTKDLDSKKILDFFLNEMRSRKYEIVNIDITVICEKIIFKNIKDKILKNLEIILGTKNISFKATRFEKDVNEIKCNSIVLLKNISINI